MSFMVKKIIDEKIEMKEGMSLGQFWGSELVKFKEFSDAPIENLPKELYVNCAHYAQWFYLNFMDNYDFPMLFCNFPSVDKELCVD